MRLRAPGKVREAHRHTLLYLRVEALAFRDGDLVFARSALHKAYACALRATTFPQPRRVRWITVRNAAVIAWRCDFRYRAERMALAVLADAEGPIADEIEALLLNPPRPDFLSLSEPNAKEKDSGLLTSAALQDSGDIHYATLEAPQHGFLIDDLSVSAP